MTGERVSVKSAVSHLLSNKLPYWGMAIARSVATPGVGVGGGSPVNIGYVCAAKGRKP